MLPDPDDTLDRIFRRRGIAESAEAAVALCRILELSVLEPSRPQRRFRLVGAMATWSIVVMLVADTQLYAALS